MKIYLAHPIKSACNWAQIISNTLSDMGVPEFELMNPFDYTPNIEGNAEKLKTLSNLILKTNKDLIRMADLVIAVIDNRDMGVIWELGYAHASQVPIVTVSAHDYDNNIMIQNSVLAHVKNFNENKDMLGKIVSTIDATQW